MKTSSENYHLLSDDESVDEPTFPIHRRTLQSRPRYVIPLIFAFIVSLCLNVFFGTRNLQNPYLTHLSNSGKSYFGINHGLDPTNECSLTRDFSWAYP